MAGSIREEIVLHFRSVFSDLTNDLKNVKKNLKDVGSVMGLTLDEFNLANKVVRMGTTEFNKFAKTLSTSDLASFNVELKKNGDFFDTVTNSQIGSYDAQRRLSRSIRTGAKSNAADFRSLTHGAKGFRMELLGVMFFGQMLKQSMLGLLSPALQTFGVFDLLKDTLLVVFLPIIKFLFPFFLKFMEFLMKLPKPIKFIIGVITIFVLVIGALISVFGALALGIGSIILLFATAPLWVPLLTGGFTALLSVMSTLLPVFGAFAALALGSFFTTVDFGKFGDSIKSMFAKVSNFASKIMDKIKFAFVSVFGGVGKFFKTVFGAITDAVFKLSQTIFVYLGEKIIPALEFVWVKVRRFMPGWAVEAIDSGFVAMTNFIKDVKQAESFSDVFKLLWTKVEGYIPDWAKDAISAGFDVFLDFIQDIKQINSLGDAFKVLFEGMTIWESIGVTIASKMVSGILKALLKKLPGSGVISQLDAIIRDKENKKRERENRNRENREKRNRNRNNFNDIIKGINNPVKNNRSYIGGNSDERFSQFDPKRSAVINQTLNIRVLDQNDLVSAIDRSNSTLLNRLERNLG